MPENRLERYERLMAEAAERVPTGRLLRKYVTFPRDHEQFGNITAELLARGAIG